MSGDQSCLVSSLHKIVVMAIHHGFANFSLHVVRRYQLTDGSDDQLECGKFIRCSGLCWMYEFYGS